MSDLQSIKEFGCPYSTIQCRGCKWNYADTCNFDFDSYQKGRADAIEEIIHRLDNSRVNCHEDYEDGILFAMGVIEDFAEKLKEQK